MTDKELQDKVEELIDVTDIDRFLWATQQVCWAKSTHLIENWQDSVTSRYWSKIADGIGKTIESAT